MTQTNLTDNNILFTIPGHVPKLHVSTVVAGPRWLQSFPFPFGSGLVQVLSLSVNPSPHVFEHLVRGNHSEYPPSISMQ